MLRSLKECYALYMESLADQNLSKSTLKQRKTHLERFIDWCEPRGVWRSTDVTKHVVQRYQRHLRTYVRQGQKPMGARTQLSHLGSLRSYFKYLSQENFILFNPAADIVLPRIRKGLPRTVLTAREAEVVLAMPDLANPLGIRDRAIMETLYSTGMRRIELIRLRLCDLDEERGVVWIRHGKGDKDRVVPIGERALEWIEKYSLEVRPDYTRPDSGDILFLSFLGKGICEDYLTQTVKRYIDKARIGKTGSCHVFRHTAATLMLENGADIRYVQLQLGHVDIQTTQIYTHISIAALKKVHEQTHPAKPKGAEIAAEALSDDSEEQPTVEDLFTSLAAEVAEELVL